MDNGFDGTSNKNLPQKRFCFNLMFPKGLHVFLHLQNCYQKFFEVILDLRKNYRFKLKILRFVNSFYSILVKSKSKQFKTMFLSKTFFSTSYSDSIQTFRYFKCNFPMKS